MYYAHYINKKQHRNKYVLCMTRQTRLGSKVKNLFIHNKQFFQKKKQKRSVLNDTRQLIFIKSANTHFALSRCARLSDRHGRFVLIIRPVYKYNTLENMTGARRLKYYKYVLTKFLIFVYRIYVRVNNMLILICVFNGSRNRTDVSYIITMSSYFFWIPGETRKSFSF